MASPEVLTNESPGKRVYSRREKCIALFVGAWLVGYGYGTDVASGVLYAKLLEDRSCTTVNSTNLSIASSVNSNQNGTMLTTGNAAVRTTSSEEDEENSKTSECGGLGEGVSATVWVPSIYTAVRCFCSPLGGIVLDTFGTRGAAKITSLVFMIGTAGSLLATAIFHLYFTTVVTGIGGALSTIVGFKIANSAFPQVKDLVGCICGLCIAVIVIIIAFVGTYAMEEAGWRGYYYMINAIVTCSFLASFFLPIDMYTIAEMDMTAKKSKCGQIVARFRFSAREFARGFRRAFVLYRDVGFHLLNIGYMFYSMGAYFPFVFVAKQAKDFGASEAKANRQVVYIGPALGLGAIAAGTIFNRLRIRPLVGQGLALMGLALATISMSVVKNYDQLLIVVTVFAAFTGPAICLASAVSFQSVTNKQLASHCHGHAVLWSTIPVLAAPPFAAFLYDVSNTYTVPYVTGGVCLFIGGILLCVNDRRSQLHNTELKDRKLVSVSRMGEPSEVPSDVENILYHSHGNKFNLHTFTSITAKAVNSLYSED